MLDQYVFYRCSIEGYQDTLYAYSNLQFYCYCDLYETVNLIFGNTAAVYQNCNIFARVLLVVPTQLITAKKIFTHRKMTGIFIHIFHVTAATLFCGEFQNTGPGASTLGRVT
ncbi:hypothetical protein CARUB_v10011462mg [Capsella rubella]|uniref:Pectinesterase catalytic domain-containing protein n=1 Tax=Capsella rubella TaxID=81985 RepID=R0GQ01_9BRAS|nr:hypothetical protein CARUB_v10011462mg [Capsella rubella]